MPIDRNSNSNKENSNDSTQERATLAKDALLLTMGHELRTPLNAIIGFSGTLLMKLPGPLNRDQEEQLGIIKDSAKQMLIMINDIMDLIKIESGKVNVNIQEIDFKNVINDIILKLSPLANAKGLLINFKTSEQEMFIKSDPYALTKIIMNIANNAIKFTDKGEISVQFARQKVDNEKYITIHILDTGIGIRTEDLAKLFQAFQPIRTAGHHESGAGLGLHMSDKLAKLLNAKIDVKSEYGKGSRFSILLPDN